MKYLQLFEDFKNMSDEITYIEKWNKGYVLWVRSPGSAQPLYIKGDDIFKTFISNDPDNFERYQSIVDKVLVAAEDLIPIKKNSRNGNILYEIPIFRNDVKDGTAFMLVSPVKWDKEILSFFKTKREALNFMK